MINIKNFYLTDEEIIQNKEYSKVLDNCGSRTEANMENVKNYILKYNWEEIILLRHQIYIEELIISNFNILKLSKRIGINLKGLLSIFLRIESQFELYEQKLKSIEKKKIETEKNILNMIQPKTGNINKDEKIRKIIYNARNHIDLLPLNTQIIVRNLLQGYSIDEICCKLNKNKYYLITSIIIGRKNPRYASELGIEKMIKKRLI